MAVTKTEFQVNSGNTGWTAQHVLDALETALGPTGAGLHSGPSKTGVIRKILKPTDGWDQIGGIVPIATHNTCLLYTSPSPRDRQKSRMPSSA